MHRDIRKDTISDLSEVKKWKAIPQHDREILSANVFCRNRGVTTIAEGYSIRKDKPYGIILRGKCKQCEGMCCAESD